MIRVPNSKYTVFRAFDGTPLDDGYIYIGEENRNPQIYPVNAYFDKDYQISANQPIRTSGGNALNGSSIANIFVANDPFSMLIVDKNGLKITYQPSMTYHRADAANENLLNNGDYQLFGLFYQPTGATQANCQNWVILTDGTDSTYQFSKNNFAIGENDNGKWYTNSTPTNLGDLEVDAYAKFSQFVDDIFSYAGRELTLSFKARAVGNVMKKVAVSFDIFYATLDQTSIGSQSFVLGEDFKEYTHTVQIPTYPASSGLEPYPAEKDSCLIINFWLIAGSDYIGQTSVEEIKCLNPDIADIKLEYGGSSTNLIRKPYAKHEILYSRKYETSFERDGNILQVNQPGYIEFIAPGIQNFIPGFRFRSKKRTNESTVRIFSYATKDEDKVTLVGTGDIDVSNVDDIGYNGVGAITLATPTAAGNVYKYHYIIEDEYTL